MGYSLSWMAVKGKAPQAVRDEFSFRITDQREEIPESDLSAVEMPSGWYLIVSNHTEQVVSDAAMRRLASSGCELVTCFVEEHVMVSRATGWKDGQLIWSVTHDAQESDTHLEVEGEPPAGFAVIRDRLTREQEEDEEGGVDFIFNVPIDLAKEITGYSHETEAEIEFDFFVKPTFFQRVFGK